MHRLAQPVPTLSGVLLVALLAGCTTAPPSGQSSIETPTEPQLTVDVRQTRTDVDGDMVTLLVANIGDDPFTVTDVRIDSEFFATAPHWTGETVVPAHLAKALRVPFPDAVCGDGRPTDPVFSGSAEVAVQVDDGGGGFSVTLPASDSLGAIPRLTGVECALADLAATADIALSDQLRTEDEAGRPTALVDLVITPSGAGAGAFTIDSSGSTVLLRQTPDTVRQLDLAVTATMAPTAVTLRYVPSRCDPHAVAEDKVGTRIPLTITFPDGAEADIVAPASSELKGALFRYVAQYCGW